MDERTTPERLSTVNTATIIFVVIALAIAALALAFGIIAYQNYNNMIARNQQIVNNLRLEVVKDNIVVQEISDNYVQLDIPLNNSATTGNIVMSVTIVNPSTTTFISDYPFIQQLNTLRITIPTSLAVSLGIIVDIFGEDEYQFNSAQWNVIVPYRVPLNNQRLH